MAVDRRRHRRYVLQTELTVLIGAEKTPVPGKLLDLSAGGAFITARTAIELGAGTFVHMVYQHSTICEATGHVVRTLPFGSETGAAIEFAFANQELVAFLHTYKQTAEALRWELLQALSDIQIRLP
ncbi:MAG: PilZ domain-containing protein [Proteobacteria bacterium]|nr:PilZ domain-containing protein [Pseudomonadota bacterium]